VSLSNARFRATEVLTDCGKGVAHERLSTGKKVSTYHALDKRTKTYTLWPLEEFELYNINPEVVGMNYSMGTFFEMMIATCTLDNVQD
jgi:hypothetical protein